MIRMSTSGWFLLTLTGLLFGCAGVQYTSTYPRPPEQFASHDVEDPFFDLHWTLERKEDRVVVQGIVTAARVDAIQDVTLEVVGLDPSGQVLSRTLGTTYGGRMSRWQSRPFYIRLRPTGREARFDVRVWQFRYELGPDGGGSQT